MSKQRRKLHIACALDSDIFHQVENAAPVIDRARYDYDVVHTLERLYQSVDLVPINSNLDRAYKVLKQIEPDVVFNLAYCGLKKEPTFAEFLDRIGLPYTGSGQKGIALADDKIRSRKLLRAAGLHVPRFVKLPIGALKAKFDLRPPLIVKPALLGASSSGIYLDSLVMTQAAAMARARRVWTRCGVPAVCDEFIVGRELRIGVVEDRNAKFRVAGITEILFPKSNPGWGFWSEGIRNNARNRHARGVHYRAARLPKKVKAEIHSIADKAMRVLDLRGYATLDVRLDARERCIIIEVNANPGLSSSFLSWRIPSFTENIRQIVGAAHNIQKGALLES